MPAAEYAAYYYESWGVMYTVMLLAIVVFVALYIFFVLRLQELKSWARIPAIAGAVGLMVGVLVVVFVDTAAWPTWGNALLFTAIGILSGLVIGFPISLRGWLSEWASPEPKWATKPLDCQNCKDRDMSPCKLRCLRQIPSRGGRKPR